MHFTDILSKTLECQCSLVLVLPFDECLDSIQRHDDVEFAIATAFATHTGLSSESDCEYKCLVESATDCTAYGYSSGNCYLYSITTDLTLWSDSESVGLRVNCSSGIDTSHTHMLYSLWSDLIQQAIVLNGIYGKINV